MIKCTYGWSGVELVSILVNMNSYASDLTKRVESESCTIGLQTETGLASITAKFEGEVVRERVAVKYT